MFLKTVIKLLSALIFLQTLSCGLVKQRKSVREWQELSGSDPGQDMSPDPGSPQQSILPPKRYTPEPVPVSFQEVVLADGLSQASDEKEAKGCTLREEDSGEKKLFLEDRHSRALVKENDDELKVTFSSRMSGNVSSSVVEISLLHQLHVVDPRQATSRMRKELATLDYSSRLDLISGDSDRTRKPEEGQNEVPCSLLRARSATWSNNRSSLHFKVLNEAPHFINPEVTGSQFYKDFSEESSFPVRYEVESSTDPEIAVGEVFEGHLTITPLEPVLQLKTSGKTHQTDVDLAFRQNTVLKRLGDPKEDAKTIREEMTLYLKDGTIIAVIIPVEKHAVDSVELLHKNVVKEPQNEN